MANDSALRPRASILSMMKDEGHSLLEWVAYHRHIGFDRISVYTNNCSDGTDDMLIRLEEMGLVHHFRNDVPEGKKPQPNALGLAMRNPVVTDTDWLLVMDADEFVSVKVGRGKIGDVLDKLPEDTDALALTWRFFGANGVTDWNPGLVTETYTRAAPDTFTKGWGVKTMFRPFEDMRLGIHRPRIRKQNSDPEAVAALAGQKWVNGSGEVLPPEFNIKSWRSSRRTLGYKWVELNHYGVKSYEAYLLRRIRGNVNNKVDKYNAAYFTVFNRNEIEAPNVLRHLRGTKRMVAGLLEDPKLRSLQEQALDYHSQRVERLRATDEYEMWLEELRKAAEVPLDQLHTVLFISPLPREAKAMIAELQAKGVPDRDIALVISASKRHREKNLREAVTATEIAQGAKAQPGAQSADADGDAQAPQHSAVVTNFPKTG